MLPQVAQTKYDAESQRVVGVAAAVVRNASPEDVVVALMHFEDLAR